MLSNQSKREKSINIYDAHDRCQLIKRILFLFALSNRRGRPPKQGLPFDDFNDDEQEHAKKYRMEEKETNGDGMQHEDGNGKLIIIYNCNV